MLLLTAAAPIYIDPAPGPFAMSYLLFSGLLLAQLAVVVYVLWLAHRLVRAVERLAETSERR